MKLQYKILASAICIGLLGSCSRSRLDEYSPSVLTADNLFTSQAGFQNALNGLYDEVRRYRSGDNTSDPLNNIMCTQAVIGVDNAFGNYRDGVMDIYNYFGSYNNASQGHNSNVWKWLYETINAANTIVNRAEKPGIAWSTSEKARILAETRCIRAWCYRHLTYLWGDVPLTLEESQGTNIKTDWKRTPVADVRKAMEADWLFAEQNLPDATGDDAKLIKGIPQHYLAELYLSTGDYTKAQSYALKVTQNPNYQLVTQRYGVAKAGAGTAFTDMFIDGNSRRSQGNTEALWVIQNELNVLGGDGNNIMRRYWVNRYYSISVKGTDGKSTSPIAVSADNGGRGIGRLSPTRWAMNLYATNDDRGSVYAWRYYYLMNTNPPKGNKIGDTVFLDKTGTEKLSNPNWPSTRKWDYASPIDPNVDRQYNDQVLLRAGETYLLLAEADFRLNDLQGAANAINALRNRAHASTITSAQVTLDLILDERSRELFSEEDRRYALLRTGKWLERVKLYNKIAAPTVAARDTLLPIPQDVIDANLTLKMPNNPGY